MGRTYRTGGAQGIQILIISILLITNGATEETPAPSSSSSSSTSSSTTSSNTATATADISVTPSNLDFEEQRINTFTERRITITNNVPVRHSDSHNSADIAELLKSAPNVDLDDDEYFDDRDQLDPKPSNSGSIIHPKTKKSCTISSTSSSSSSSSSSTCADPNNSSSLKLETLVRLDPIRTMMRNKNEFVVKPSFDTNYVLHPGESAYIDVRFYPTIVQDYHAAFVISYQKSVIKRTEDGQSTVYKNYGDISQYHINIVGRGIHNSFLPHTFIGQHAEMSVPKLVHYNSSITAPLYLHNPHGKSMLEIIRVASSSPHLHIDWPEKAVVNGGGGTSGGGTPGNHKIEISDTSPWQLSPHETKSIAYFTYIPKLTTGGVTTGSAAMDNREIEAAHSNLKSTTTTPQSSDSSSSSTTNSDPSSSSSSTTSSSQPATAITSFYDQPDEQKQSFLVVQYAFQNSGEENEEIHEILYPLHLQISKKPGIYTTTHHLNFGVLNTNAFDSHNLGIQMKAKYFHNQNDSHSILSPTPVPQSRTLELKVFPMCKPTAKWIDLDKRKFRNSFPDGVSVIFSDDIRDQSSDKERLTNSGNIVKIHCEKDYRADRVITLAHVTMDANVLGIFSSKIKNERKQSTGNIAGAIIYNEHLHTRHTDVPNLLDIKLTGKIYTGKGLSVHKQDLIFDLAEGTISNRIIRLKNNFQEELFIEKIELEPDIDTTFLNSYERQRSVPISEIFTFEQSYADEKQVGPNQVFKAFSISFNALNKKLLKHTNTFTAHAIIHCREFILTIPLTVHANRLDVTPKAMTEFSSQTNEQCNIELGHLEQNAQRFYSIEVSNGNPVPVIIKSIKSNQNWLIVTHSFTKNSQTVNEITLAVGESVTVGIVVKFSSDQKTGPVTGDVAIGDKLLIRVMGIYTDKRFDIDALNFNSVFPGRRSALPLKIHTDEPGIKIIDMKTFSPHYEGFKIHRPKSRDRSKLVKWDSLVVKLNDETWPANISFKMAQYDCFDLSSDFDQENHRPCYMTPIESTARLDSRYAKWYSNLKTGTIDRINSAKNTAEQELEMFIQSVSNWKLWKDRKWNEFIAFLRIKTSVFTDVQIPIKVHFVIPSLVENKLLDFSVQDHDRESTMEVVIENKGDTPMQVHPQSLDQYAANIGYRVYETVTLEAHEKARKHLTSLLQGLLTVRPELKEEILVRDTDNTTSVLNSLVASCIRPSQQNPTGKVHKTSCEKTPQFFAISRDEKSNKTMSAKPVVIPRGGTAKIVVMYSAIRQGTDRSMVLLRNNHTYFDAFITRGTAVQETIFISKLSASVKHQLSYGTLFPQPNMIKACRRGLVRHKKLKKYYTNFFSSSLYKTFPMLMENKEEDFTINDFIMREKFTLQNSGIKPITIVAVYVGPQTGRNHAGSRSHPGSGSGSSKPQPCHWGGFSVSNCTGFTIDVNKPALIYVHFAPDFSNLVQGVKVTFVTNVTTRFDWNVTSYLPTRFDRKGYNYIQSRNLKLSAEKFLDEHIEEQEIGFSEACRYVLPDPGYEKYLHFWTFFGFFLIVPLIIIISYGEGSNWFAESIKWIFIIKKIMPEDIFDEIDSGRYIEKLTELGIKCLVVPRKMSPRLEENRTIVEPVKKVTKEPKEKTKQLKSPDPAIKQSIRPRVSSTSSAATQPPPSTTHKNHPPSSSRSRSNSKPQISSSNSQKSSSQKNKPKPLPTSRFTNGTSSDDEDSGWEHSNTTSSTRRRKNANKNKQPEGQIPKTRSSSGATTPSPKPIGSQKNKIEKKPSTASTVSSKTPPPSPLARQTVKPIKKFNPPPGLVLSTSKHQPVSPPKSKSAKEPRNHEFSILKQQIVPETREELIQDAIFHQAAELMSPNLPTPPVSLELLGQPDDNHENSMEFEKYLFNPFRTKSNTKLISPTPPSQTTSAYDPKPTNPQLDSLFPPIENDDNFNFNPLPPIGPRKTQTPPTEDTTTAGRLSSIFAQDYSTEDPLSQVMSRSSPKKEERKDSMNLETASGFFNFNNADEGILEEIEPDSPNLKKKQKIPKKVNGKSRQIKTSPATVEREASPSPLESQKLTKPRSNTTGSIWDVKSQPFTSSFPSRAFKEFKPRKGKMEKSESVESNSVPEKATNGTVDGAAAVDEDEAAEENGFDFDVDKVKTIWKEE